MDEFDETERTQEEGVGIAPPWVTLAREFTALFEQDPEVAVQWDDDEKKITLMVDDDVKADALTQIVPAGYDFGGVRVAVEVVPCNSEVPRVTLFRRAFDGNPALSFTDTVSSPMFGDIPFAVFQPKVVQFPNDDLSDYYGVTSTLYEDVARDVFPDDVVRFSTDIAE